MDKLEPRIRKLLTNLKGQCKKVSLNRPQQQGQGSSGKAVRRAAERMGRRGSWGGSIAWKKKESLMEMYLV